MAVCRRPQLCARRAQSFDRIATYTTGTLNLTGTRESARIDIEFVSPEYFDVTGVQPIARARARGDAVRRS